MLLARLSHSATTLGRKNSRCPPVEAFFFFWNLRVIGTASYKTASAEWCRLFPSSYQGGALRFDQVNENGGWYLPAGRKKVRLTRPFSILWTVQIPHTGWISVWRGCCERSLAVGIVKLRPSSCLVLSRSMRSSVAELLSWTQERGVPGLLLTSSKWLTSPLIEERLFVSGLINLIGIKLQDKRIALWLHSRITSCFWTTYSDEEQRCLCHLGVPICFQRTAPSQYKGFGWLGVVSENDNLRACVMSCLSIWCLLILEAPVLLSLTNFSKAFSPATQTDVISPLPNHPQILSR